MDKSLILKILSKKDSVDLDDQIYNLRDITEELSTRLFLGLKIDNEYILEINRRLKAIYNILNPIKIKLRSSDYIVGYTNSKAYLSKFIDDICINIKSIIKNLQFLETKELTYHTNILMDLVLSY